MTIPKNWHSLTLKEVLEEQLLIPRKIRHFLRTKKHVLINEQFSHWQTKLNAGDDLTLIFDEEDYPPKTIPFGEPSLVEELYQDEHIIIVNKPEGMKTHGNDATELALLNHVSAHVQQTCYVVHRLDKETSGAVLFAKNPFILPILNRLLEDKRISREYWALVEGKLSAKSLVYKDKIGRDRHDRRKRLVDNRAGQYAETHIQTLKTFPTTSLVQCRLKTGRTHQIRVHLSHHGHPILGDPLYHPHAQGRLLLHAYKLTFTHPLTLQTITVKAPSTSFEQGLDTFKRGQHIKNNF
ncbi:pseudouridine synthase [Streptococcus himalayensis]|uniref:Pseudouridine synthase n=2 Tax=Streptococcus himalayensis TaxID=1888195 RepID=A0A917A5K9_9STRE|nr:pseudouridine synthase [Streptococcus himalayensis]